MKWELKEPNIGDIIRVKIDSIYHYGIFVSDEEIIQFGLPPTSRNDLLDADIEVCVSDINNFLLGGFLEVGIREKKDKKRVPPKKTVEIARSRLGQKGYNILYNNCEHFANECYWGEKFCSQTNFVRELFRNLPIVDVYIASVPLSSDFEKVFPRSRHKEINSISNEIVKREKYFVWKLLEYAIKKSFGKNFTDLKFEKNATGKWVCDACEFSLSHSNGVVCVAVSQAPVGVDIEKIEKTKIDISKEILSQEEYSLYENLLEEEKISYIIRAWTKKESLFKSKNIKSISRDEFKQLNGVVFQKNICINEDTFSLSVATNNPDKVKLCEHVNLL